MSARVNAPPSELPLFAIGLYSIAPATPLLDPPSLETAFQAYSEAEQKLRARAGSALRPRVRHSLASRVLRFAIFGERNPRRLSDRALAHFE